MIEPGLQRLSDDRSDGLAPVPAWQAGLQDFFCRIQVDIAVGVLVLVSVGLTVLEFSIERDPGVDPAFFRSIVLVNDLITALFVIELGLRFLAARSKRQYFREFWLDILATLPLFRVFRAGRALRLLRLVRVVRLFGVASRLTSHYPNVFRRGAWDFLVVCTMLVIAVVFGTVAMLHFEHRASLPADGAGGEFSLEGSFWYSVYTLFAGEPIPGPPRTVAGRITTVVIMFMGLTIFAIFTGTVSAFMVDRLRIEGRVPNFEEIRDHVIICGWSVKTEIIIREYRSSPSSRRVPIIVITERDPETFSLPRELRSNVHFLQDDFTRVPALEQAGIHRATTCIILSDVTGGRSDQDVDARTILASLTVEKISPTVFTCAELINSSYGTHLEMGHVNEFVVSGEFSAYLLAQAAMNRGLLGLLKELLTIQRGKEFFRKPVPPDWIDKTFLELLIDQKMVNNIILVGVYQLDGQLLINPRQYRFRTGDEIVAISSGPVSLSD